MVTCLEKVTNVRSPWQKTLQSNSLIQCLQPQVRSFSPVPKSINKVCINSIKEIWQQIQWVLKPWQEFKANQSESTFFFQEGIHFNCLNIHLYMYGRGKEMLSSIFPCLIPAHYSSLALVKEKKKKVLYFREFVENPVMLFIVFKG